MPLPALLSLALAFGRLIACERDLPMPSEIAIRVEGLSKRYYLYDSPLGRMRSLVFGRKANQPYIEALKELSFSIKKGAFFGIIGQNGSGKSTLLQMIAGILAPSTGAVHCHGRIAALLELGAGFNPEFTGRENARLNAQILGISHEEFERKSPEIEAFADIGEFIDQPVKTYSSGMFVRLAFAVQACVEPDILIIDEALAVGDIFFRLKCYERIAKLRAKGCTIILVTHGMDDVMVYCDQVLLLEHGQAIFLGDPSEGINRYYALGNKSAVIKAIAPKDSLAVDIQSPVEIANMDPQNNRMQWPATHVLQNVSQRTQASDGLAHCQWLAVTDDHHQTRAVFRQGESMFVYVEFAVKADLETPVIGFVIRSDRTGVVHGRNTGQCETPVPTNIWAGQIVRARFEIPLELGAGEYLLDVGFATWPSALFAASRRTTMAELEASSHRHCVLTGVSTFSIVPRSNLGFDAQPFYGVAGLESNALLEVQVS
jgi:lipopolysaccharide transport system ATP-binding protein